MSDEELIAELVELRRATRHLFPELLEEDEERIEEEVQRRVAEIRRELEREYEGSERKGR